MSSASLRVLVAAALLGGFFCSCSDERGEGSARRRPVARAEQPKAPARLGEHWMQGEQLKEVMGRISEHAARWPAGVPDGPESPQSRQAGADADEAFRDAAALADGLAQAARQIPRSVADHPMSAEDRRGFAAEAERLRTHALGLRRAARERRVEPMQRSLDQISSTCVSCHCQYRDFSGELGPRKASAE